MMSFLCSPKAGKYPRIAPATRPTAQALLQFHLLWFRLAFIQPATIQDELGAIWRVYRRFWSGGLWLGQSGRSTYFSN